MLNKISFGIDQIDAEVKPVQKYMLPDTHIGFDTTINDYALYLEIKSIITPQQFLFNKNFDTLLVVQFKDKKPRQFPNYRLISKNEDKDLIVSLITRLK